MMILTRLPPGDIPGNPDGTDCNNGLTPCVIGTGALLGGIVSSTEYPVPTDTAHPHPTARIKCKHKYKNALFHFFTSIVDCYSYVPRELSAYKHAALAVTDLLLFKLVMVLILLVEYLESLERQELINHVYCFRALIYEA